MGNNDPKLIVIYFQTLQDKKDAMRFKSQLKGMTHTNNKPLFINDYIPAATQERRRHERQVIEENKDLDCTYRKGGLAIQGMTYKPKNISPHSKRDR